MMIMPQEMKLRLAGFGEPGAHVCQCDFFFLFHESSLRDVVMCMASIPGGRGNAFSKCGGFLLRVSPRRGAGVLLSTGSSLADAREDVKKNMTYR